MCSSVRMTRTVPPHQTGAAGSLAPIPPQPYSFSFSLTSFPSSHCLPSVCRSTVRLFSYAIDFLNVLQYFSELDYDVRGCVKPPPQVGPRTVVERMLCGALEHP